MKTITISKLTAKTELPVIVKYKDAELLIEKSDLFLTEYKIGKVGVCVHNVNTVSELKELIKLEQLRIEEKREREKARMEQLQAMREKSSISRNKKIHQNIIDLAKSKGWTVCQINIMHNCSSAVVMIERENRALEHAFSTHFYDIEGGAGFYFGHYDMNYSQAVRSFNDRSKV